MSKLPEQLTPPKLPSDGTWQAWAESLVTSYLVLHHERKLSQALSEPIMPLRWLRIVAVGNHFNNSVKLLHQFRAQEHQA